MRKLVLFAAASLAFLPAFEARAAEPSSVETADPSSPDTVVVPVDFAARPTVGIDTALVCGGDPCIDHEIDSAFTVTFTFSEKVRGFEPEDFDLVGATRAGTLATNVDSVVYTINIQVNKNREGDVTITVPANVAQNVDGEGNIAMTLTFDVDNRAPELGDATASGDTVLLPYHEVLDEDYEPDDEFTVTVEDSLGMDRGFSINWVRVRESRIHIKLSDTIKEKDAITVTYTPNGGGDDEARDLRGNLVPMLDGHEVRNTRNVPPRPPSEVRRLEAEALDTASIEVDWVVPADPGSHDIDGYVVEGSEDGEEWDSLEFVDHPTTEYLHEGLGKGERWHYRVYARSEGGDGPPDTTSARTEGGRPSPPRSLAAEANGSNEIQLTWEAPEDNGGSDILGYVVDRSPDGKASWSLQDTVEARPRFYADRTVEVNTTYFYRVSAYNADTVGEFSNVDSATTEGDPPGPPTALVATARDTSRIGLSWAPPEDDGGSSVTGYRIEFSLGGSAWTDAVADTESDDTTYAHSGLPWGTTHHYRVSAINDFGEGEPSDVDFATTFDVPDPPPGLTATAIGQTQINLGWPEVADNGGSPVDGYRIEVSDNAGASWTVEVDDTRSTSRTYPHTGLTAGETWHYRVSAKNRWGYSEPSDTAAATTDPREPGPPLDLRATADGQTRIDLEWEPPEDDGGDDVTGYMIQYSENAGDDWSTLVANTGSTRESHADTGLDPGTRRHYRVAAINSVGAGDYSPEANATTDPTVPDAPTGLAAAAAGESQINLSWTKPEYDGGAEITGYQLEVSETGSAPWVVPAGWNYRSTVTSYMHGGLDPGDTRHYRVSAINVAGTGPVSIPASATTDPVVPDEPTGLVATADGSTRITLGWTAPSYDGGDDITGYRVDVSADGGVTWTVQDSVGASATSYTHTGLAPATTRHYRVAALNSVGPSMPSNVASATTDATVPDEPTDLEAVADGTSQIDLAWSAPDYDGGDDISGYWVDVSTDGGVSWTALEENVGANVTSYTHTGLAPATTRHYRVAALNSVGASTPSNVAGATTDATVPDAPTDLEAVADGTSQIDLAWSAPDYDGGDEISGYLIEESRDGGEMWTELVANTGSTSTAYSHTGLAPATTVRYRVAAINSEGAGDYSNVADAKTDATVPDAPTDLQAEANGTSQIDLAWDAPDYDGGAAVSGYLIEESRDEGDTWRELVANTGSTSTAYSHTGLAPATTVHYRVSAINEVGAGAHSDVAFAKTDATVPDPPTDLQAEANGTSQIDLAWSAPDYDGGAAVSGYRIEESRDEGDTWRELVANTGSTSTAYSHTGLAPATAVHYRVSAINEVGAGDHSNEASAKTDATVPDPPTDLQAVSAGISQIDLAWSAPEYDGGAAVSGYRIEVSEEGDMWTELVANTGSTSTAHTHDNLPPATTRHYRVFALNEVGASLPSDTAAATTDPDFADPPTGLSAEANGPYEIELSWTEPVYTGGVPVTGYRIEVLARGGEWTELVDDTRSTSTSHRHEGLRPASTRSYRVSAINAAGVGDPSEVATATTDPVVPDAPTALTVEADGTSRLLLSWTAPEYDGGAEVTGYRIEVSANAGENWRELVANTNTTRTGYAHEDLRPATTRHYRISAINEAGVGTASEPGFATTDATVPDAPTGLAAAADGPYQIQLAWEVPPFDGGAPISGYRVEVSEDGGSSWQDLAANTGSTETSYEHADLDPAATRHYRVSGINEIGTGEPSEVASATTDAIPPDPPTGLTATAVSPTQIDLAWVAPEYDGGAEITGYMIEFSADSAASWAVLEASTGSTLTEYSHTNLPPGSTRFYRVSAINVAGTGEPSNVASASTDDPVGRAGRVNEAILPHFAAASTTSALDAIGARIEAVADRNPLMGQLKAAGLASLVGRAGRDGALSSRLIDGMSFSMPLGSGGDTEGLGVATWGSAEYTLMSDEENEKVTWDGGMLSLHLGVDVRVDRDFLVGVSAGRSSGTYDFTDLTGVEDVSGTYEARMNSLYPYVAWLPGRTGVAVWGVSGFGWGEVVVDDSIAGRRIGTARSMTGALAGSRILAASGGSKLRVRTEGWASRVKVDGDAQMDSLTIDMQRGRLALEWSQGRSFGGGDEVTFMLEGGARFGSGDGTDGVGMEVGGGLRYNNAAAGLTLEGRGRLLSAGSGYQEIGFRGLLQVDPQGSEGLSVKVVPALGDAASAVDELWDRGVGQLVQGGSALARRVDARMEYGFAAFHGTPYSRIRMVDGGSQSIGTGVRYDLAELLEVQLEGTRNQGKLGPARHAVSLRGQLVF